MSRCRRRRSRRTAVHRASPTVPPVSPSAPSPVPRAPCRWPPPWRRRDHAAPAAGRAGARSRRWTGRRPVPRPPAARSPTAGRPKPRAAAPRRPPSRPGTRPRSAPTAERARSRHSDAAYGRSHRPARPRVPQSSDPPRHRLCSMTPREGQTPHPPQQEPNAKQRPTGTTTKPEPRSNQGLNRGNYAIVGPGNLGDRRHSARPTRKAGSLPGAYQVMVGGIGTPADRLEATTTDPAVAHPVAALGDRPSGPASTCPGRPRPVGARLVGLVVVGTTARWARTEPLSPDRTPRRGRRWRDHREVIDAIARKLRTGSQWAHQPEQYGPEPGDRRDPAAGLHRPARPDRHGGRPGPGRDGRHHHRARAPERGRGPPKGAPADEPAHHAVGRSRSGPTTKTHLAADGRCHPLCFHPTPDQTGDAPAFEHVMAALRVPRPIGRPRTRPAVLLADRAHSSRAIREHLRRRGIRAAIPQPADRKPQTANADSEAVRPAPTARPTSSATPSNGASGGWGRRACSGGDRPA